MTAVRLELAAFNELPAEAAGEQLAPLCGVEAWVRALVASRPFATAGELAATSDGVLTALGWSDVQAALAADPSGLVPAVADSEDARAYETRFGVPFVLDVTGKTADRIRALLDERLGHDEETEHQLVRHELAAVVRLRLLKTFV
jgi:2-oxo-4-hydroxy-4-carboxy-5-ureidoimidazoline decarboxylase